MKDFISNVFFPLRGPLSHGALEDRPDSRDWQWNEFASAYAPFEWGNGFDVEERLRVRLQNPGFRLPVKQQRDSGSCGGQAWATYGSVLEAMATGTFEERSAKFIYSQTYVNQPGGGSSGRDNNNLVKNQGFGHEPLTPSYINREQMTVTEEFMRRPQDITDLARQKAKHAKAISYASVNQFDIDEVAHAIASNNGIILGYTGVNNGTARSLFPVAPREFQMPFTWRHFVYGGKAKVINGKKAIGIINSWGEDVGERGWQWITEDYFTAKKLWYANTIMFNDKIQAEAGFKHSFFVNMKLGDENEEVRALQVALQQTGDFPAHIKPTGFYGNATAQAVYAFQLRNVITPPDRNNAGPKTRAALNRIFGM